MILWAAVSSASSLVQLLFSGLKNLAVEAVWWSWAWLLLLDSLGSNLTAARYSLCDHGHVPYPLCALFLSL